MPEDPLDRLLADEPRRPLDHPIRHVSPSSGAPALYSVAGRPVAAWRPWLISSSATARSSTGRGRRRSRATSRSPAASSPRSATSTSAATAGDRRRRAARHAGLRRHPHALRRPGHVGPDRRTVVASTASPRSRWATAASASHRRRPDRHDWLIGLLEGVEDIPGTALAEGLTWDWETFPEYLDALDAKPHTRRRRRARPARRAAHLRDGRARRRPHRGADRRRARAARRRWSARRSTPGRSASRRRAPTSTARRTAPTSAR